MSAQPFKCTSDDMDELHDAVHRVREGTTKVSVAKETLFKLLTDHAEALTLLRRPR